MGFLSEACEELDDEAGGNEEAGCLLVDETGIADQNECRLGPACSAGRKQMITTTKNITKSLRG